MFRMRSSARVSVLAATLLVGVTVSSQAQYYGATHRFEITPFGAYQTGGTFDTDALANIASGKLSENSSVSWGGILSFLTSATSAAEIWYLRQDTDVDFNSDLPSVATKTVGDFANNYIQLVGGAGAFWWVSGGDSANRACTWAANQRCQITIDWATRTCTLSGFLTGNGSFTLPGVSVWSTAAALVIGRLNLPGGNCFNGVIGRPWAA